MTGRTRSDDMGATETTAPTSVRSSSARGAHRAPSTLAALVVALPAMLFSAGGEASTATYYFHTDHLGTPQTVTDADGDVVWKGRYDPFGNATETVADIEQNFRLPGQYLERETGLHQNWFREYDPQIGRYTESDPIGLRGSVNTYAYASQSPSTAIDPQGLEDRYLGVEGEVVLGIGVEGGFGIVYDTDSPLESGVYSTVGVAVGLSAGAGITAGTTAGDIEGYAVGVDANFGAGVVNSLYCGIGENYDFYAGGSGGVPGAGLSAGLSHTSTFTLRDIIRYFLSKSGA